MVWASKRTKLLRLQVSTEKSNSLCIRTLSRILCFSEGDMSNIDEAHNRFLKLYYIFNYLSLPLEYKFHEGKYSA